MEHFIKWGGFNVKPGYENWQFKYQTHFLNHYWIQLYKTTIKLGQFWRQFFNCVNSYRAANLSAITSAQIKLSPVGAHSLRKQLCAKYLRTLAQAQNFNSYLMRMIKLIGNFELGSKLKMASMQRPIHIYFTKPCELYQRPKYTWETCGQVNSESKKTRQVSSDKFIPHWPQKTREGNREHLVSKTKQYFTVALTFRAWASFCPLHCSCPRAAWMECWTTLHMWSRGPGDPPEAEAGASLLSRRTCSQEPEKTSGSAKTKILQGFTQHIDVMDRKALTTRAGT